MKGKCTERNRTQSQLEAEKIAFPPKLNGRTYDRRTDTSTYRVASLLKRKFSGIPYILS